VDAGQDITVSVERIRDRMMISARGELDCATTYKLVEAVEAASDYASGLFALDFGEVTFIDSEGIKLLLALHGKMAGRGVRLCISKWSRQVIRAMSLLGIEDRFSEIAGLGDTIYRS